MDHMDNMDTVLFANTSQLDTALSCRRFFDIVEIR